MRSKTSRWLVVSACVLGLPALALRGDNLVTGVGASTSWDSRDYNAIVQWRVAGVGAAATVTRLGRVRLGSNSQVPAEGNGLLGYNCQTLDVAMLKDGRVAVLHANAAGNGYQVSLFTMLYDSGALTGATLHATLNTSLSWNTGATKSIAPTGDGGFVVFRNSANALYFFTPSGSTFSETSRSGTDPRDGAGTIAERPELAYQSYGAAVQSYRYGYDGTTYKVLARYSDLLGTTANTMNMDGLRNPLTPNGWVIQNYNGSGATVCDNATLDGSTTTCIKGHLYESDGTTPFTAADRVAGLADGRVVMVSSPTSQNNMRDIFYIFKLTTQGLPAGESVGAVGYNSVTHQYATKGMGAYGVRIIGDYQVPPSLPGGMVIMLR